MPIVVLKKPQFLNNFFLEILCLEINDTIYDIESYKYKHTLINQVLVKPW